MLFIFLLGVIAAVIAYRSVRNSGSALRHIVTFVALAIVVGFLSLLIFQLSFTYPSDRYFQMAPVYGVAGGVFAIVSPIVGFLVGWLSRRKKTRVAQSQLPAGS